MASRRLDQLRIRHFKFIGLLASLGSLAATADHLSMTPSAASMMLKEIESIFAAKLFVRQGRGMALTEAGQALMPRCQTVLGEVGAMGASLAGSGKPLLRIGAFPHTTATVLPQIVNRLINAPSPWCIQILDHSADRLLELLLVGEIDLLLGRLPNQSVRKGATNGLMQRVLYQSGLAVVASNRHPLLARQRLTMQVLLAWPWVLPNTESTTRVALVDAFLRHGLTPPDPVVESPSFFYSLSLVAQSDLLTCCAVSAAEMNQGHTAILPIDMGAGSSPVALVWRKASTQANRVMEFLESTDSL